MSRRHFYLDKLSLGTTWFPYWHQRNLSRQKLVVVWYKNAHVPAIQSHTSANTVSSLPSQSIRRPLEGKTKKKKKENLNHLNIPKRSLARRNLQILNTERNGYWNQDFTWTGYSLTWFALPTNTNAIFPAKSWAWLGTRALTFLCSSSTRGRTWWPIFPITPFAIHCAENYFKHLELIAQQVQVHCKITDQLL